MAKGYQRKPPGPAVVELPAPPALEGRRREALQLFQVAAQMGADPQALAGYLASAFNDPEFSTLFGGVPPQPVGGQTDESGQPVQGVQGNVPGGQGLQIAQ